MHFYSQYYAFILTYHVLFMCKQVSDAAMSVEERKELAQHILKGMHVVRYMYKY